MSGIQGGEKKLEYWIVPLVFLVNFIVFYISTQPLMDDSDVPWHLAAGRLLLETGEIPRTDPWSFASSGEPWYLLSWIWDLILGILEKTSGLYGVLIFVLSLCASIVAMMAAQLVTMRVTLSATFFIVMVAGLCILDFITARPHLGGYALAMVFYMLLYRSRDRGNYGGLLWLPPLMLVWANTHGSFIVGFTLLAAYIVEAFAVKNYPWLKRLIVISLACGLCSLINPYGLEVTIGALKTLNGSARQYTIEWLPFTFSASAGISTWLVLFILASNLRGSGAAIADKLLAIAWLLASMFIIRNGPLFIILSAPYLARCMDEATLDLRDRRPPSVFVTFIERQKLHHVWMACAALFALFVAGSRMLPYEQKIMSADQSVFDAIDYAKEHYGDHRFLSNFNFGGQVIYRTGGSLPFFMDSRAGTVYSEEAIQDYLHFMWLKPDWQERLAKYKINGILMYKTSSFSQAYENGQFRDKWQLVFAGRAANVYIARP
jgi:hypothetical protein